MDPIVAFILEFGLLVLTGVAALAALVQANIAVSASRDAEKAQIKSEAARDEAAQIARDANAEFKRQSDALDRIADSAQQKEELDWTIQPLRGNRWEVVNNGTLTVPRVRLRGAGEAPGFIRPDEAEARDLNRGDGIAFIAFRVSGPDPVVRVEFFNPITNEDDHFERPIR